MSNQINLQRIVFQDNKIIYDYQVTGLVQEAFNSSGQLTIDYFEDITKTPMPIAAIPFLANVLPIAWVYDAEIIVDELDQAFVKQLDQLKQGFINMYPKLQFGGKLTVRRLIDNSIEFNQEATGLLFSGGVDATSSLITMLDQGRQPRLITLWGADVSLDDQAGWQEKSAHTNFVAEQFGLETSLIKSQFRTFLNEGVLDKKVEARAGDMWWHGFQHGLGILGHAAPLIYKYKMAELHIAATFVEGNTVPCASDPSIDEHFSVSGHRTVHNGYDLTRQKKVANICQFATAHSELKRLPIKVCWKSEGAKNCGQCEKCMRTACEFIAEGGDLEKFALENFDADYARHFVATDFWLTENLRADWEGAQRSLLTNNPSYHRPQDDLDWLKTYDFQRVNRRLSKKIKRVGFMLNKALHRAVPNWLKRWLKRGQA